MKILILVFLIVSASFVFGQDQWIAKDSINGQPRSAACSFVVEGEAFTMTGLDESGFRRKMYSYSYWVNDWDDESALGGLNGSGLSRGSASSFSIGDKGFICLGQGDTNPYFKDLWEYNPDTQVWTQMADFIGSPRRSAVSFTINLLGYVGTGKDETGYKKDMYSYNSSTNTWTQLNDFAGTARKEAVGFSMGDQAYIGTGDDGVMKKDFWQYQVATDTWIQKADLPGAARKGAVGWGIFPTGFICTGEDINFNYSKDLWEYNYFTDSWIQRADFPGPGRSNATAFVLQGNAFVGSGYDGIFYDDLFSYQRIVGLESNQLTEVPVIYPNPIQQEFHVKVDPSDLKLKLFSLEGKDVTDNTFVSKTNSGFTVLRKNLPAGNYILQFEHNEFGHVYQNNIIFL